MKRIIKFVSSKGLSELVEELNEDGFFVTESNIEEVVTVFRGCETGNIKYSISLRPLNGETMIIYTREDIRRTNQMENRMVWGYFNGEPKYTEEDWIYSIRHRGACASDEELIALAKKISSNWYNAGWHRTFTTYYLDSHEFDRYFTRAERKRLHELQAEAIAAEKAADEARGWRLKGRYTFADNSTEEVWVDKDGIEKTVMVEAPHGDACY